MRFGPVSECKFMLTAAKQHTVVVFVYIYIPTSNVLFRIAFDCIAFICKLTPKAVDGQSIHSMSKMERDKEEKVEKK